MSRASLACVVIHLCSRRLVGVVAISWAAYGLVQYLGLEVEVEVVNKDQKPAHPGDSVRNEDDSAAEWEVATGEEEDEDDVILFLPTGFSRPAPKKLWRGSDPEWQEFKKIATDSARINKIRGMGPGRRSVGLSLTPVQESWLL